MGKITVDEAMREKLANAGQTLELCDGAGNVIGYFTPKANAASLEPQISEEEIDRRMREGRLYTYAEVMAHLRSL